MAFQDKHRRNVSAFEVDPEEYRPPRGTPGKSTLTSRLLGAPIMRKPSGDAARGDATSALAGVAGSTGAALPAAVQAKFEAAIGVGLNDVRVHTGTASQQAARAIGARAFTVGHDIHMAAGQYAPTSAQGERLLAHEVVHTVQQRGVSASPQAKLEVSQPGDALEVEADRMADQIVTGQSVAGAVSRASGRIAHRTPEDESSSQPQPRQSQAAADNLEQNTRVERQHLSQLRRQADQLLERSHGYAQAMERASMHALERIRRWRDQAVDEGFARLEQDYSSLLTSAGSMIAEEIIDHALEETPVLGGMYKLISAAIDLAQEAEEIRENREAVAREHEMRTLSVQSQDALLGRIFQVHGTATALIARAHQRVVTASEEVAGDARGSAGQNARRETQQLRRSESGEVSRNQAEDYDDSAAGVARQGQEADAAFAVLQNAVGSLRDAPAIIANAARDQLVRAQSIMVDRGHHGTLVFQASLASGTQPLLSVSGQATDARGHNGNDVAGDASLPVIERLGMRGEFHLRLVDTERDETHTIIIRKVHGELDWVVRMPDEDLYRILGHYASVARSYQRQDGVNRMVQENGHRMKVAINQALRSQTLDMLEHYRLPIENHYGS